MAKASGGGTAGSWRRGTNAVPPAASRLIEAVQSGKLAKMSNDMQNQIWDDAMQESPSLNIKDAEERYTTEQLKSLAVYHSSFYSDINDTLRGKADYNVSQHIKTLDSMFDYTLKKSIIVYRGTEKAPTRGIDKAYQSTSLSAAKAEHFTYGGRHLHAYRLPAGTKVLYVGGSEEEVILPRGFNLAQYKIK